MGSTLGRPALRFLREMQRNNDREWFSVRKQTFLDVVQAPWFDLIDRISAAMSTFAPEHVRPANKVALRIYRDTRFSADKRPFKDHLGAWWGRDGMAKTSGAGFYMHIGAKDVVMAAGIFMPTPEQLARMRALIAENGAEVRSAWENKTLRKLMPVAETDSMKRVPKGYAPDHAEESLLRARKLGVSITLPAEAMLDARLSNDAVKAFRAAAPLVDLLNKAFAERQRVRAKSLF